jgi:hypothetical protein
VTLRTWRSGAIGCSVATGPAEGRAGAGAAGAGAAGGVGAVGGSGEAGIGSCFAWWEVLQEIGTGPEPLLSFR